MKKLSLILIFSLFVTTSFANFTPCDSTCHPPKEKPFMTYYTLGGGFAPFNKGEFKYNNWVSIEAGCWGVKKPVMYGASLDFGRDTAGKMNQVWAGVKPYYQLYQGENYYFFTYFGPKLNLNTKQVLIETGLVNYTQVSKHFYTSCAFGVQMYNGSAYPGFNFGLNLVY